MGSNVYGPLSAADDFGQQRVSRKWSNGQSRSGSANHGYRWCWREVLDTGVQKRLASARRAGSAAASQHRTSRRGEQQSPDIRGRLYPGEWPAERSSYGSGLARTAYRADRRRECSRRSARRRRRIWSSFMSTGRPRPPTRSIAARLVPNADTRDGSSVLNKAKHPATTRRTTRETRRRKVLDTSGMARAASRS